MNRLSKNSPSNNSGLPDQSENTMRLCQPIRRQYSPCSSRALSYHTISPVVSTNQKWLLYHVNQSGVSIMSCQPIRGKYYFMSTNQRRVLLTWLQSDSVSCTSIVQDVKVPVSSDWLTNVEDCRDHMSGEPAMRDITELWLVNTSHNKLFLESSDVVWIVNFKIVLTCQCEISARIHQYIFWCLNNQSEMRIIMCQPIGDEN